MQFNAGNRTMDSVKIPVGKDTIPNTGVPVVDDIAAEKRDTKVQPKREVLAYGITIGDWIKFVVFAASLWSGYKVMEREITDLKGAFAANTSAIVAMNEKVSALQVTTAVLAEQFKLSREKDELQRELDRLKQQKEK